MTTTSFFITIDSNLSLFANDVANRITRYSLYHVTTSRDSSQPLPSAQQQSTIVRTAACSIKPQTLFTLKAAWQNNVNDTCSRIKMPYNYSDIILYNTLISYEIDDNDDVLDVFRQLETCTKRNRMSFVYIDARHDYRFIQKRLNNVYGERCAVVVNKYKRDDSVKISADYLILLNENNASDGQISKFMAFLIKSYQKFGNVPDVSLGKNTKQAQKSKSVIKCNIYDFIDTSYDRDNSICYDCVQIKI